MDAAERATLVRVATRNLVRKFTGDIAGLTTFADGLASQSQATPVTVTQTESDGGNVGGQVTMPREVWLAAAEELLADVRFNPNAPDPTPRVIQPDFRFCTAV